MIEEFEFSVLGAKKTAPVKVSIPSDKKLPVEKSKLAKTPTIGKKLQEKPAQVIKPPVSPPSQPPAAEPAVPEVLPPTTPSGPGGHGAEGGQVFTDIPETPSTDTEGAEITPIIVDEKVTRTGVDGATTTEEVAVVALPVSLPYTPKYQLFYYPPGFPENEKEAYDKLLAENGFTNQPSDFFLMWLFPKVLLDYMMSKMQ